MWRPLALVLGCVDIGGSRIGLGGGRSILQHRGTGRGAKPDCAGLYEYNKQTRRKEGQRRCRIYLRLGAGK